MKFFGGPPGCVSFIPLDIPCFLLAVAVNCAELLFSSRLVTVQVSAGKCVLLMQFKGLYCKFHFFLQVCFIFALIFVDPELNFNRYSLSKLCHWTLFSRLPMSLQAIRSMWRHNCSWVSGGWIFWAVMFNLLCFSANPVFITGKPFLPASSTVAFLRRLA